MFRKSLLSLVAFAAVVASVASFGLETASAAEPTAAARTVFNYLDARDYSPEFDSDGDIVFKHEDGVYTIIFDREDDEYFRILYLNFWTLDSAEELQTALRAANRVNLVNKAAKVAVPQEFVANPVKIIDSPYVAVETFSADPHDFSRTIPRSLKAIQAAALKFGVFMLAESLE